MCGYRRKAFALLFFVVRSLHFLRQPIVRSLRRIPCMRIPIEKLSRIRKAFEAALQDYEDSPEDYIPVGKKTQPYIIHLSHTRILWQPEGMSVF